MGGRLVLDKFMFTLMGFRNLIGQVPTAVLRLALERYTHAQVMWKRMRPKRQLDGGQREMRGVSGGAVLSSPQPVSAAL